MNVKFKTVEERLEDPSVDINALCDELPEIAAAQAKQTLSAIRDSAKQCSDADTVYGYSGLTHRFIEKALNALFVQVFYNDGLALCASKGRLTKFESIESRLAELEEREIKGYRGVYRPGMSCKKGEIYTRNGSAWICKMDTDTCAPGDGSQCFQLFVKSGRDGKGYKGDAQ